MRLSRYSIIGIMVALVLSAVAIMPVFGAVTGTIGVSKPYVSPGGTATVTVDDADLNVLLARTQTITGADYSSGAGHTIYFDLKDSLGNSGTGLSGFGKVGTAVGDQISGTPTITSVTDGAGNIKADYALNVFNAATGRVSITYGGSNTPSNSVTLNISYNLAQVNTTTVKITSPSDSTGISVTLNETGADTGVFSAPFHITAAGATQSDDANDKILAVAGQTVTLVYADANPAGNRQTTITVENTKPVGSLVGPANGLITSSKSQTLQADFTDTDSGVDAGTIAFNITHAMAGASDVSGQMVLSGLTTSAITNGFRGSETLDASAPGDTTIGITWYATATDKAGNVGRTDADPATAGDQDYTLFIDNTKPNFAGATAYAGTWFDTSTNTVQTDASKAKNTMIGIQLPDMLSGTGVTALNKVEQLSPSSVTGADFDVDTLKQAGGTTISDVTPSAATVYAKAPNWIFLTVPAMAPDAKPVINLLSTSGGITDTAGNSATTGTVTALDKQAPSPTYSFDKTLSKDTIKLTINTNESGGIPTVTAKGAAGTLGQTVTLIGTNQYQATIQQSVVGNGAQSIKIVVPDSNGNSATLGSDTVTSDFPTSSNIAIYFDTNLPAPTVTLNNSTTVTSSDNPVKSVENSVPFFIKADFAAEGSEYGLTSGGAMTATAASVSDDLDVQKTVTLATVTLDGTDMLSKIDTQDNVTFNLALLNITDGSHTLDIAATDQAGNSYDTGDIKFTVTARKAYQVAMNAGWNLVSFPGTPKDTSIDKVLPSTHPATDVLTYQDGVWQVATRSTGGTWEGTLTTIDGQHGYWINTGSSQPIQALLALPSVGSAATLPSVPITQGWNLVPVIDLAQTKQGSAGDTRTAASYFTSLDWAVAYTYDSSTRTWTRVTSTSGNVKNGQGVWVWANKDGTLIP